MCVCVSTRREEGLCALVEEIDILPLVRRMIIISVRMAMMSADLTRRYRWSSLWSGSALRRAVRLHATRMSSKERWRKIEDIHLKDEKNQSVYSVCVYVCAHVKVRERLSSSRCSLLLLLLHRRRRHTQTHYVARQTGKHTRTHTYTRKATEREREKIVRYGWR